MLQNLRDVRSSPKTTLSVIDEDGGPTDGILTVVSLLLLFPAQVSTFLQMRGFVTATWKPPAEQSDSSCQKGVLFWSRQQQESYFKHIEPQGSGGDWGSPPHSQTGAFLLCWHKSEKKVKMLLSFRIVTIWQTVLHIANNLSSKLIFHLNAVIQRTHNWHCNTFERCEGEKSFRNTN